MVYSSNTQNTGFLDFVYRLETSLYRNVVFSGYLEFQTMDKVHKPSNNELTFVFLCQLMGKLSVSVRVLCYRTELYCVSCEVRTEFIYVM
jgi:hypothetical protein